MTLVLESTAGGGAGRDATLGTDEQLRLLVVDDHPAVRRGLSGMLEEQLDFRVVAAVSSAEDAIVVATQKRFDVAVVDYHLPGRDGLWLSRKLKRLPTPPRVVIYSAYTDGLLAAAAVAAEADGLVSKGELGSDLCDAIRTVAARGLVLPIVPWQLSEIIRRRLDHEEQAIYGMLLSGIELAEIGQTLDIPVAAIESRLSEMVRKLEPLGVPGPASIGGPELLRHHAQ
jgi:DNA-binding NarL/FixJ family response regulator